MKKISIIAMLTAVTLPVFAEDLSKTTEANQTAPEEQIVEQTNFVKTSNLQTKFPRGMQVGLGVSATSGLNMFVGYNNKNFESFWAKRFGVRFDFATMSPIKSTLNSKINNIIGDDGIDIDDNLNVNNISLSAKHFGALVDFYPFGNTWFAGGLRLSVGYVSGKMDLDADIYGKVADGKIEFELGGRKYYYEGDVMRGKANLDWKYNGPYLGTGFDLGIFAGFKMYLDAGVVFAGNSANIDLDVPLDGLKDITSGVPQNIQDTVLTEYNKAKAKALEDAQKELNEVDFYPLVKIGFMYRF